MVPIDKVKDIIIRHDALEKELASGNIDSKLFAKKSKEYSSLGNIILIAKKYVNFENEKKGIIPSTVWKKENLGQNWYLGETFITGIGQGYIQTTPLQLCLMTAQLANGGFKIKPNIIYSHHFSDLNRDHRIVNESVLVAFRPLIVTLLPKILKSLKALNPIVIPESVPLIGTGHSIRA